MDTPCFSVPRKNLWVWLDIGSATLAFSPSADHRHPAFLPQQRTYLLSVCPTGTQQESGSPTMLITNMYEIHDNERWFIIMRFKHTSLTINYLTLYNNLYNIIITQKQLRPGKTVSVSGGTCVRISWRRCLHVQKNRSCKPVSRFLRIDSSTNDSWLVQISVENTRFFSEMVISLNFSRLSQTW